MILEVDRLVEPVISVALLRLTVSDILDIHPEYLIMSHTDSVSAGMVRKALCKN